MNIDVFEKIKTKKLSGYRTVNKRIVFKEAIYHITQRAPGRELLFIEDIDYLYFIKLLKESVAKFNLELFSFALMPNHLHLLLKTNDENLSIAMKNIFEKYAKYFNYKYQRKGHVFCGRYRASICCDENYFLAASLYIHLNPLKAKLTKKIGSYRWSSIKLYIGEPKQTFVNYKYLLSILDRKIKKAQSQYSKMLKNANKIRMKRMQNVYNMKSYIKETSSIARRVTMKNEGQDPDALDKTIKKIKPKKRLVSSSDIKAREYLIQQLLANGFSSTEISRKLNMSRQTFYRIYKPNVTKLV